MDMRIFNNYRDDLLSQFEAGQLSSLKTYPNIPGFEFNLCNLKYINGIKVTNDFSKYRLRIEFDKWKKHPQIYIIHPKIEKLVHRNFNGSLCLYDEKAYDWDETMKLSNFVISTTYLWIVYYEGYVITGEWFGPQ